jgi:8-oxo-dGTP pyrophosphatase MutT (NUDIX family)
VFRYDEQLRQAASARLAGFSRRSLALGDLRHAAVACLLVAAADGTAGFVITRRSARTPAHPGQWALPGGRVHPSEDPVTTALRETSEEIGLDLGPDAVIGLLDDYPTRSGHLITPVVVWAGLEPRLAPDPREVAELFVEPFAQFDRDDLPWEVTIPQSDRPVIRVPLRDTFVHAPTAAVLWQCFEVVMRGRPTRVAHYDQPVFAWR